MVRKGYELPLPILPSDWLGPDEASVGVPVIVVLEVVVGFWCVLPCAVQLRHQVEPEA